LEFWYYFFAGVVATLMLVWITARLWMRLVKNKARHFVALSRREVELESQKARAQAEQQIRELRESAEAGARQRERQIDTRSAEVAVRVSEMERRERQFERYLGELERKHAAVQADATRYRDRLRALAGLDEKAIRAQLREEVALECQQELAALRNEILSKSETELHEDAKRILVTCMQRVSTEVPQELGASIVKLPSDDFKGRIIGKEGRNIRCFEAATGTTLMIDESPETVLVSSFDPVRREIARSALEALIIDGRIHPATIEAAVKKAEQSVREDVYAFGERAIEHVGLKSVPREIVAQLGRLNYHFSNNQNTLQHAVEVADLCGLLAAELGLDVNLAKRAGLFHDIGKALTDDLDTAHAEAGAALLKRHDENPKVVNAVGAHHDEMIVQSIYAPLVKIADHLSATRPGARADAIEGYISRVQALESLARGFEGVLDAYAVQAGREIRVLVEPEKISDSQARELSRQMRLRIEEQLTYPGSIRVTIIREQRFTDLAK